MALTERHYVVADTFTDLPTTALLTIYGMGTPVFVKDTGKTFIVTNDTTWTEQTPTSTAVSLTGHAHTHAATTGQTATDHHVAPATGPDANDTIDAAGAAGTAGTFARSGHGHQLVSGGSAGAKIVADAIGTQGATGAVARALHTHQGIGTLDRITSDIAIANTETIVLSYGAGIPTGVINVVGVTFEFTIAGTLTTGVTPGSGIFRFRVGPTTLTGVIPATITLAQTASVTAAPFVISGSVTVRSAGASGTLLGNMWLDSQNGAAPIAFTIAAAGLVSATTATVSTDLTVGTNKIQVSYISGNAGSTATFRSGALKIVSMA